MAESVRAESHYLIDGMYVVKLNGVQLGGWFTSATADETVRVVNSEIEAIIAPLQAELTALRKLEAEVRDMRVKMDYQWAGYSVAEDYVHSVDDALALVEGVRGDSNGE